jgi:hypothetical protein
MVIGDWLLGDWRLDVCRSNRHWRIGNQQSITNRQSPIANGLPYLSG